MYAGNLKNNNNNNNNNNNKKIIKMEKTTFYTNIANTQKNS